MENRKKRPYKRKNEQTEVNLDLEKETKPKKWQFKNINRKVLIGREEITNDDLLNNQRLAEILISKGMGSLICFE